MGGFGSLFGNRPNASGPVPDHQLRSHILRCARREHRALPKSMQVLVSLKVQIVGYPLQFFVSAGAKLLINNHASACRVVGKYPGNNNVARALRLAVC